METHIKKLLLKLISLPSPFPDETPLQSFIASYFLEKGYEIIAQQVEGHRANIMVEKGKGEKTILLYSHMDTVSPAAGWKDNPFRPRTAGDKIYGLGAYDMKGGMAVNMLTFLRCRPKNMRVRLLFCVDEENISRGGHTFAGSPLMEDTSCVLSPEPGFDYGTRGIVVGRIGRAVITIRLRRPPAHFYYYTPRDDVVAFASRIVLELQKRYRDNGNGKKEFVFVREMKVHSEGMSTPGELYLELDTSILPPETPDAMLSRIKKIAGEIIGKSTEIDCRIDFKDRPTPFLGGYEMNPNNPYLKVMKKTILSVTGRRAHPYFRASVADENIFGALGKPVLGVGPAGGNAHSGQEWVSLSSLVSLAGIYEQFLESVDTPSQRKND